MLKVISNQYIYNGRFFSRIRYSLDYRGFKRFKKEINYIIKSYTIIRLPDAS